MVALYRDGGTLQSGNILRVGASCKPFVGLEIKIGLFYLVHAGRTRAFYFLALYSDFSIFSNNNNLHYVSFVNSAVIYVEPNFIQPLTTIV